MIEQVIHSVWFWVGVLIVFMDAVNALPEPDAHSSPFYQWFFRFANGLARNADRVAKARMPEKAREFIPSVTPTPAPLAAVPTASDPFQHLVDNPQH